MNVLENLKYLNEMMSVACLDPHYLIFEHVPSLPGAKKRLQRLNWKDLTQR